MSELPQSWAVATLREIAETSSGGTPSRARPDFYGGSIPWVKSGELNDGIVRSTEEAITNEGLKNSSAKLFPSGTLCVALYGATVGRVGLLGLDAATNQAVCGIKPKQGINADYLFYFFQSQRANLVRLSQGGAQPNISQEIVRATEVPISPIAEQTRIVQEIEKQFTRLDAAKSALKRVQANLKRYRASVLKAACEGRLVPTAAELAQKEGRDYEPAEKLLERILRERRARWEADTLAKMIASGKPPKEDRWKQKYQEPSSVDNKNLEALPDGWCWASVEQLGFVQLGRQRSPQNRSRDHPTPYLRAANITEKGLDITDVMEMEFDLAERERFALRSGDVVLSEASGSPDQVGKPAIWREELPLCCFQNTVLRLQPTLVLSEYMLVAFRNFYANGEFARTAGGVGINHLSAGKFASMAVPLPPISEQKRIVEAAERYVSVVESLSEQVASNVIRKNSLRRAVLQKAFSGDLVPQDPNDEPALTLLSRIRNERIGIEGSRASNALVAKGKRGAMPPAQPRSTKSIIQALTDADAPLTPEKVFSACGFEPETVDVFYAELKAAISAGILEEIRSGKDVVLLQVKES